MRESGLPLKIQAEIGNGEIDLSTLNLNEDVVDKYIDPDYRLLQSTITAGSFNIIETDEPPRANESIRVVKFSTAGLSASVAELQSHCAAHGPDISMQSAQLGPNASSFTLPDRLPVGGKPEAIAEEKRAYASVGSSWNYEVTDQIKQTKGVVETTLTESKGNERVVRENTRGLTSHNVIVYDKDWNVLETMSLKFEPYSGTGVPTLLEIGSTFKAARSIRSKQKTGWSGVSPVITEMKVASIETITTKAGKFETYRIEGSMKMGEHENKIVYWFSPKIDHWVKTQLEVRLNGRLIEKFDRELINYELRLPTSHSNVSRAPPKRGRTSVSQSNSADIECLKKYGAAYNVTTKKWTLYTTERDSMSRLDAVRDCISRATGRRRDAIPIPETVPNAGS